MLILQVRQKTIMEINGGINRESHHREERVGIVLYKAICNRIDEEEMNDWT